MHATTTPPSRVSRVVAATTLPSSLLLALALLAIAGAPWSCDAVSPWKNAEDKLREQGLLHGDTSSNLEDDDAGKIVDTGLDGDTTVGGDGKFGKVSPAEATYLEAKKLLSDFDARARRKTKAFALLQRAIELDDKHRGALLLMGRAYQTGEGVDVDETLAVKYFEMAAELGDPGAHEELGFVYSVGWVRRGVGDYFSHIPFFCEARKFTENNNRCQSCLFCCHPRLHRGTAPQSV